MEKTGPDPAEEASYRRRGSTFSLAQRFRPTSSERGGHQRHQQFVVARDGETARTRFAAAAFGDSGTLHYILQRTVVLDKVEVGSGNWLQGHTKIADDAHGFQKNLGKKHG